MSKLIFCEGKDEVNFFQSYLVFLGLNSSNYILQCTKGVTSYSEKFRAYWSITDTRTIDAVLLTRDSDGDIISAKSSLSGIIKEVLKVDLGSNEIITSNGKTHGFHLFDVMLEDVCMASVATRLKATLANAYISSAISQLHPDEHPKNKYKARCKAFLSLSVEDCPNLGLAATKNLWDFTSPIFTTLEAKIRQL